MEEVIKNKDGVLNIDRELLEDIVVLRVGLEQNTYSLNEIKKYTEDLIESVDDKLIRSGIDSLVSIGEEFLMYVNKIIEAITLNEYTEYSVVLKNLKRLGRVLRSFTSVLIYECIASGGGGKFNFWGYEVMVSNTSERHYKVIGTENLTDKYKKTVTTLVTLVHHSKELVKSIRGKNSRGGAVEYSPLQEDEASGGGYVDYSTHLIDKLHELLEELLKDENIKTTGVDNILEIRKRVDKIALRDKPRLYNMWLREISRKAGEILIMLEIANKKSRIVDRRTQLFKV